MAHRKEGKGENNFAITVARMGMVCTFAPIQDGILGTIKVEDQKGSLHHQEIAPLLLNSSLCKPNHPLK